MMIVADTIIDAFASESVAMRAAQAARSRHPAAALHADAAAVFVHDAALRVDAAGRTARGAMREAGAGGPAGAAASPIPLPGVGTIAARRRIADAATAGSRYIFSLTA
jgi:hypothetical protein